MHADPQSSPGGSDRIVEALRAGDKQEALRLIAVEGVWMPFRDPGYFDTESCFPVFSSLEFIPPYLRKLGVGEEGQKIKVQQVGAEFFSVASYFDGTLTLNPGTEFEWRFGPDDCRMCAGYAKKNG